MQQGFQILSYFYPERSPSERNNLLSRRFENPLYEVILVLANLAW